MASNGITYEKSNGHKMVACNKNGLDAQLS